MATNRGSRSHKAQHYVAQCYLKPWAEKLGVHPREESAVWVHNKADRTSWRRSPTNLFTEQDMYTIQMPDGTRNLRLEHGFQTIEDQYTRVRNLTLRKRTMPEAEQKMWLLLFVTTAQFRTAANRDHWADQWSRLRTLGDELQQRIDRARPNELRRMGSALPPSSRQPGMSLDQVRALAEAPIQLMLPGVVRITLPVLSRMSMTILCTGDESPFVTSDTPCVWFDPEAYRLPPLYRGPGLAVRTVEVTLPLTPNACLVLTHREDMPQFVDANQTIVDELNRRQIAHARSFIVSNVETLQDSWFEERPLPEDAWENRQQREG